MTLHELQESIVTRLREHFTRDQVANIAGHRGQFESLQELKSIAVKKTNLLVCYREFGDCKKVHGGIQADLNWVIYVVTQDCGGKKRDQLAAAITNCLVSEVYQQTWGVAFQRPENLRGRNVTSHEIDRNGVCVWAISWQQRMPIDGCEVAELYDWLSTEIDTDLTPENETDDPQMQAHINMNPV